LKIIYHFPVAFVEEPWLDQTIREIYGECLNPTFEQRGGFPVLETFSTSVNIGATPEVLRKIGKGGLLARLIGSLPSVFGPGGRVEVDGWKVAVDGELFVDDNYTFYNTDLDPE